MVATTIAWTPAKVATSVALFLLAGLAGEPPHVLLESYLRLGALQPISSTCTCPLLQRLVVAGWCGK